MARKMLWALLVIGLVLVVAPFAMGLPAKADGGQQMMDDFRPIMQPDQVQKTSDYYYNVFVPLGQIAPAFNAETAAKFRSYLDGMEAMGGDLQRLIPDMAAALGMTQDQMQAMIVTQYPAMSAALASFPQMQQDFDQMVTMMEQNTDVFAQVPPGLQHYEPLVTTMSANVENYKQIDSLPPFTWFTWFFVVPGALIVVLAAFGLFTTRRRQDATIDETPIEPKTLESV